MPARSHLLMTVTMGMPRWAHTSKSFIVWTSRPFAASTSMTALSTAERTRYVSSEKSACPGVSRRLKTTSSYSNWRAADVIEMPRSCSIVIQSETVERRPAFPWTAPAVPIARAWRASASVSVDLPESGWEMTAKVRLRFACARTSAGLIVEEEGPEFTAPV